MLLHFPWLLDSSSILLAHALLTLGSENSVHSKTIGIASRISKTPCLMLSAGLGSLPPFTDEETEARGR